ncbi:BgTH12-00368 [Blumeria graminis f. sp. triticale]|uniref:BgTH12-00361 n=1 Tax=Blumeria graminis f. sp. triticale TaxID=1689686 RepID=A0A9W4DR05_BLUGR|nr:BgTH12-00361 [Blumeria graminis f. sp. triticale]CAD6504866.1 BgTH12-00368 [Blumeria graminis f. sp. triticale]
MHPLQDWSQCQTELSSYIVVGKAILIRVMLFECRASASHK